MLCLWAEAPSWKSSCEVEVVALGICDIVFFGLLFGFLIVTNDDLTDVLIGLGLVIGNEVLDDLNEVLSMDYIKYHI